MESSSVINGLEDTSMETDPTGGRLTGTDTGETVIPGERLGSTSQYHPGFLIFMLISSQIIATDGHYVNLTGSLFSFSSIVV